MAASRQKRSRKQKVVSDESTEQEEEDQPAQSRSRLAKGKLRATGSLNNLARPSGTLGDSTTRVEKAGEFPNLQGSSSGIDLNDDIAEKRRRRKSTKPLLLHTDSMNDNDEEEADTGQDGRAGPSGSNRPRTPERQPLGVSGSAVRTPKMTALARATHLNSVDQTPVPAVSMDVMSSNFEEWMKMATDNKINANNAWDFALIDYFQDMSLLRNERDNSINFQKASFTLEGCVKIWTSRVDSVGTETGKLLSNLADEVRGARQEDNEEGGEEGETQRTKKAKAHRPETTIAKSITQLQVKKLDLEFTVDPLFKKTSADFDEGGATGLLMNHLGVDQNIRVVFDAGDSRLENDDEEVNNDVQSLPIDLTELRSKFIPSVEEILEKSISQSFSHFRFSQDADVNIPSFAAMNPAYQGDDDESFHEGGEPMDDFPHEDEPAAADFFTGDQAVTDGYDIGMAVDHVEPDAAGSGAIDGFDPRRAPNEHDLVMALAEEGDGMMDYFDSTVMKNWAGPEHWKLRRGPKKTDATQDAGPKAKREKQAFSVDFESVASTSSKQLFAPASKTTILLTAAIGANLPPAAKKKTKKLVAKRDDHLLPDDMHFSSAQLLRLFLKPKFTAMQEATVAHDVDVDDDIDYAGIMSTLNGIGNGDGEIDENFWAQAAAQGAREGGGPMDGEDGQMPFNAQFFHDDYDDAGGFDEDFGDAGLGGVDGPESFDDDLMAATQGQLKRTRAEYVNYAKRAKRVDVRRLKENIWKSLDIVVDHKKEEDQDQDQEDDPIRELTDPGEARRFTSVIEGLQTSYSKEKMDDISTSFCFICLLHLANEQGLKLEVEERATIENLAQGEDDVAMQKRVGDIWGVKVFRDPSASQAA